jgi:RHS repeat-associated protein
VVAPILCALLAAFQVGSVTLREQPGTETRVRGINLAAETASGLADDSSPGTHREISYTYGGTASDRANQYNGRVFDSGTGFHDYGARMYWPQIGRFISADSVTGNIADPASLNLYSYVKNNPYKYTDPTGHCPLCVIAWVYANAEWLIPAVIAGVEALGPGPTPASAEMGMAAQEGKAAGEAIAGERAAAAEAGAAKAASGGEAAGTRLGAGSEPQRYQGPWTKEDLARAEEGKGPQSFTQDGKPLEVHHGDQMPGSGVHEVTPGEHQDRSLHPNPNQGVTRQMREEDRQLHWQMRGQEMGNPPPEKQ